MIFTICFVWYPEPTWLVYSNHILLTIFSDEDSSGHSVGSPDTGNVNNLNNSTKKPRTKRGEYSYDASWYTSKLLYQMLVSLRNLNVRTRRQYTDNFVLQISKKLSTDVFNRRCIFLSTCLFVVIYKGWVVHLFKNLEKNRTKTSKRILFWSFRKHEWFIVGMRKYSLSAVLRYFRLYQS